MRIVIGKHAFTVTYAPDHDAGLPWENCDGHGPVRRARFTENKKPGERLLKKPDRNEWAYFYDWQQACKIALRDSWNMCKNKREACAAVQKDFDYLAGFLNDQWHYVVVCVESENGEAEYLGGVESNSKKYLESCAQDLAEELHARMCEAETLENARLLSEKLKRIKECAALRNLLVMRYVRSELYALCNDVRNLRGVQICFYLTEHFPKYRKNPPKKATRQTLVLLKKINPTLSGS